jgi:hypothetical protein
MKKVMIFVLALVVTMVVIIGSIKIEECRESALSHRSVSIGVQR